MHPFASIRKLFFPNVRLRRAVLGGKWVEHKNKNNIFLTSQVRCADMPLAGRKIHLFTFLTKNYQPRHNARQFSSRISFQIKRKRLPSSLGLCEHGPMDAMDAMDGCNGCILNHFDTFWKSWSDFGRF